MSYKDIRQHIEEIYALSVSEAAISTITDRLIPALKQWQQRPLDVNINLKVTHFSVISSIEF